MFEFLRRSSPLWGAANFNRLWAAQILSAFGSRITRTAIPIIAVSVLTVSAWEAAVLAALCVTATRFHRFETWAMRFRGGVHGYDYTSPPGFRRENAWSLYYGKLECFRPLLSMPLRLSSRQNLLNRGIPSDPPAFCVE